MQINCFWYKLTLIGCISIEQKVQLIASGKIKISKNFKILKLNPSRFMNIFSYFYNRFLLIFNTHKLLVDDYKTIINWYMTFYIINCFVQSILGCLFFNFQIEKKTKIIDSSPKVLFFWILVVIQITLSWLIIGYDYTFWFCSWFWDKLSNINRQWCLLAFMMTSSPSQISYYSTIF